MKPLESIYDSPSKGGEFLAGLVGTLLILAIIFGVLLLAVLISLSGTLVLQPFFCTVPLTLTFGGIQWLYRWVKSKRFWALLGVGVGLLFALIVGFLASLLFRMRL